MHWTVCQRSGHFHRLWRVPSWRGGWSEYFGTKNQWWEWPKNGVSPPFRSDLPRTIHRRQQRCFVWSEASPSHFGTLWPSGSSVCTSMSRRWLGSPLAPLKREEEREGERAGRRERLGEREKKRQWREDERGTGGAAGDSTEGGRGEEGKRGRGRWEERGGERLPLTGPRDESWMRIFSLIFFLFYFFRGVEFPLLPLNSFYNLYTLWGINKKSKREKKNLKNNHKKKSFWFF